MREGDGGVALQGCNWVDPFYWATRAQKQGCRPSKQGPAVGVSTLQGLKGAQKQWWWRLAARCHSLWKSKSSFDWAPLAAESGGGDGGFHTKQHLCVATWTGPESAGRMRRDGRDATQERAQAAAQPRTAGRRKVAGGGRSPQARGPSGTRHKRQLVPGPIFLIFWGKWVIGQNGL